MYPQASEKVRCHAMIATTFVEHLHLMPRTFAALAAFGSAVYYARVDEPIIDTINMALYTLTTKLCVYFCFPPIHDA